MEKCTKKFEDEEWIFKDERYANLYFGEEKHVNCDLEGKDEEQDCCKGNEEEEEGGGKALAKDKDRAFRDNLLFILIRNLVLLLSWDRWDW